MDSLGYSISIVLFAVILAETMVGLRAGRAVRGSRERYVAMTQRRILSWAVNVGFAAQGVFGILGNQQFASLSLLMAVWLTYQELKNHKDDDDWFNGRMKKIWRGVKKRLAALKPRPVHLPSPLPAPAPAF